MTSIALNSKYNVKSVIHTFKRRPKMAALYPCDWQLPIKIESGTKSMGKRVSLLKRRIQGFMLVVSIQLFSHASGPHQPLTYLELYSRRKSLVNISWRHPPTYSWYRCEGPGAAIRFKGVRKDQTALDRLSSRHLKTLRFSRGDKKLNICTKCNMIEATPQHLLYCVALVYDDLLKRLISCWR
ncbi:hypothetical protein AVEN_52387-1 [Araneus ventricosus]|uniref:Uncharacterized protein n=1 Tax=Araneus ventricosus TaxID=182803 RepID=A0A4Y2L3U3_ARAVE|nr:hypothetical protein AVEN_52387-1 [Araneus ventricosus]